MHSGYQPSEQQQHHEIEVPPVKGRAPLQQVPGNFVFIGNGASGQEGATPLHNACYDFNDRILSIGARYFAEVVRVSLPK